MNCAVHPSLSMQPFQNSIQHRRPFDPSWLCQPEITPFPHWFCHIPNIPTQILPHIMRFTLGQLTCQPAHCWDVGGYWASWRRWWGLEQVSYNCIEWWGKFEGQTGSLLFLFSYVLMLKPTVTDPANSTQSVTEIRIKPGLPELQDNSISNRITMPTVYFMQKHFAPTIILTGIYLEYEQQSQGQI